MPVSLTRTDRDHPRVLSICHYVLGGLTFFGGVCVGLYFAVMYAFIAEAPGAAQPNGPPEFIGWFFLGIAAFLILFYWLMAALLVTARRYMSQRRNRTLCLIAARLSSLL